MSQIDKISWSAFVYNHPNGNIFQTPEMYEVYENTKNHEPIFLLVKNNNGKILATLLSVIKKEYSGLLGIFSARSIIWGGPLIRDNDPNILDIILKKYNELIKEKAIFTQVRNLWQWGALKAVFEKNGFVNEDHLDVLIDLKKSEEELKKDMHKGRRKNIQRAGRVPLFFEEITNAFEFEKSLDLITRTYKKLKLPMVHYSIFNSADMIKNGFLKKFAVKYNDKMIATRYVLCYKDIVYDWYAGSDENHLDKYPNDYLPWKIIQWARENGYKTFDFGGAGKPNVPYSVRDFKVKFGGNLVNFGRFEKIHKPVLFKIGVAGFHFWKIFMVL